MTPAAPARPGRTPGRDERDGANRGRGSLQHCDGCKIPFHDPGRYCPTCRAGVLFYRAITRYLAVQP